MKNMKDIFETGIVFYLKKEYGKHKVIKIDTNSQRVLLHQYGDWFWTDISNVFI